MPISASELLHLLNKEESCSTLVLDLDNDSIEDDNLDIFRVQRNSLLTKHWSKLQASLDKFTPSSTKGIVLICSSEILLNALRHKLIHIHRFKKMVLCDTGALLSTQNGKLFTESALFHIFEEYLNFCSFNEGLSTRPKIFASLSPSLLSKAATIASSHSVKDLHLVLNQLIAQYHIDAWWNRFDISQTQFDVSVHPLPLCTRLLSNFDDLLDCVSTKHTRGLFDSLLRMESEISPRLASALRLAMDGQISFESSTLKLTGTSQDMAPLVMRELWLKEIAQFQSISHASEWRLGQECGITMIIRFLAQEERHWRHSPAVIVVKEKSFASILASLLGALIGHLWHTSVEIDESQRSLRDRYVKIPFTRASLEILFGPSFLTSIEDLAKSMSYQHTKDKVNRRIFITSSRNGLAASLKFASTSGAFERPGFVFILGRLRFEHELWRYLEDLSLNWRNNSSPSTSSDGKVSSDVGHLSTLHSPTSCKIVIATRTHYLRFTRNLVHMQASKLPKYHSMMAHLMSSPIAPTLPFAVHSSLTSQFPHMPIGSVDGMLNFPFSSFHPSSHSSTPINSALSRSSPHYALSLVYRWLHCIGNGRRRDTSQAHISASSHATEGSKLPKYVSQSHTNTITWHKSASTPQSSKSEILARFPTHSPLHGLDFHPLFSVAILKMNLPQSNHEIVAEPRQSKYGFSARRASFLKKSLPILEKRQCALHVLVHLYAMNLLDECLRPTWKLPLLSPINADSCIANDRYATLLLLIEHIQSLHPSQYLTTRPIEEIDPDHTTSLAHRPLLSLSANITSIRSLRQFLERLRPSAVPMSLEPKRGIGIPRAAVLGLSELLIEEEHENMEENHSTQLEALIIVIRPPSGSHLDTCASNISEPSLKDDFSNVIADNTDFNRPSLGENRIALISKNRLFPPHRLPHSFPFVDKDHQHMVCTLLRSEILDLSLLQVRKLRQFHHRLFSLVKLFDSHVMSANWDASTYQYIIAPLLVLGTDLDGIKSEIDWKSLEISEVGIECPSPSVRLSDPEKYRMLWREFVGSLVYYESQPEQRYLVNDIDFDQSPLSPSSRDPSITIKEAMFLKHNYEILDLEQPLLSVKLLSVKPFNGLLTSSALNSISHTNLGKTSDSSSNKLPLSSNPYKYLHLVPEMVKVYFKSVPHHIVLVLGSLLYRIETYARMEELLKEVNSLENLSWSELLATFSPRVANEETNFEVLETYGDCILKLIVSAFLTSKKNWSLNNRAGIEFWSHRWISNWNLCTLAMARHLDSFINIGYTNALHVASSTKLGSSSRFVDVSGKSRQSLANSKSIVSGAQRSSHPSHCFISGFNRHGEVISTKSSSHSPPTNLPFLNEKTIADFVESLLGAAFYANAISGSSQLLAFLGMPELSFAQTSVSPSLDATINDTNLLELILNYRFSNSLLLKTALSCGCNSSNINPHAPSISDTSSSCPITFDSLTILGDALLDYFIFHFIRQTIPNATPGDHTLLKSFGVSGLAQSIIAISINLHRLLQHSSPSLQAHIDVFESSLCCLSSSKDDILSVPFWMLTGLDFPETLSLALEALIGAVFEDTGRDIDRTYLIFMPLLEQFWKNHVRLDSNSTQDKPAYNLQSIFSASNAVPSSDSHGPRTHDGGNRFIPSFWPKSLLSSLQQHLPTSHCRAYTESPPQRLPLSRAYFVKSSYHNIVSIGLGTSKKAAQNDSALRLLLALLSQKHCLTSQQHIDISREMVIDAMAAVCTCPPQTSH